MPDNPTLRIHRLSPGASLPRYQSDGAAGLDLSAALPEAMTIPRGAVRLVPTGLAVEIPEGYEGQIRPRSGLAIRQGVTVVNAPGTIDSDYRGEVRVGLVNLGPEPYTIEAGERIAQLVIAPVTRVEIEEVGELTATARGAGGFGSTGR
ncbi:MAG: dUTP diphosphatase [Phycisphaeraceae bacterium]|nr:dUTP diphosphatase [Phycisphaeraceae bacterium]